MVHPTNGMTSPENVVEAVQLLHSLATPVANISRRLKLDQATTLHVIKHGQLPVRQMTLSWANPVEVTS